MEGTDVWFVFLYCFPVVPSQERKSAFAAFFISM